MENPQDSLLPTKKGIKYAMPPIGDSEDEEEANRSTKRAMPNTEDMAIFENFENPKLDRINKESPLFIYKQIVENLKSKNIPGIVNFRKMEETKIKNFLAK